MTDIVQSPTFKLNYTSSSKLVSIEAEHIGIAASNFSWCQIDRFASIRRHDGTWRVYLDVSSLTAIRQRVADEILRPGYLELYLKRVRSAEHIVGARVEALLNARPAAAPMLASKYVLAFASYLALYRGSDPVATPTPSAVSATMRPSLTASLGALAHLRLKMRERFEYENRRFDTWLVAQLRNELDLASSVAQRMTRRITLNELMSFPDLRDIDAIVGRALIEVETSSDRRSISFDPVGWEQTAVWEGFDLASVGARTEPVVGRVYDARMHAGTMAPAGSIVLVATATPDLLYSLNSITGVLALEGGYTSHAALMSRERGIPCLICPDALVPQLAHGTRIRLDPRVPSVELVEE